MNTRIIIAPIVGGIAFQLIGPLCYFGWFYAPYFTEFASVMKKESNMLPLFMALVMILKMASYW